MDEPIVDDLDTIHPSAERLFVRANGRRHHSIAAGPDDGEPVVLLHGFPEFWYAWRDQLAALADAGYRAIAPDLRGYNLTERPADLPAYRISALVADAVALIDALADGRAHVVGHDWGGVIAWELAAREPTAVDRLAILNAPHPGRYDRALRDPDQLLRSWYVGFVQLPWLPERLLTARDGAAIRRLLRTDPVDPSAFSPTDRDRYAAAFCRGSAATAALNYYRALFRGTVTGAVRDAIPGVDAGIDAQLSDGYVDRPTLLLWGEQDTALSPRLTEGLDEWVPELRIERFPDASHWLQADAPEAVNAALVDFFD